MKENGSRRHWLSVSLLWPTQGKDGALTLEPVGGVGVFLLENKNLPKRSDLGSLLWSWIIRSDRNIQWDYCNFCLGCLPRSVILCRVTLITRSRWERVEVYRWSPGGQAGWAPWFVSDLTEDNTPDKKKIVVIMQPR